MQVAALKQAVLDVTGVEDVVIVSQEISTGDFSYDELTVIATPLSVDETLVEDACFKQVPELTNLPFRVVLQADSEPTSAPRLHPDDDQALKNKKTVWSRIRLIKILRDALVAFKLAAWLRIRDHKPTLERVLVELEEVDESLSTSSSTRERSLVDLIIQEADSFATQPQVPESTFLAQHDDPLCFVKSFETVKSNTFCREFWNLAWSGREKLAFVAEHLRLPRGMSQNLRLDLTPGEVSKTWNGALMCLDLFGAEKTLGGIDVYLRMFSWDLLAFFWSVLYAVVPNDENPEGPDAAGSEGQVSDYLTTSLFLILIVQFFMMMLDRMIYCYSSIPFKVLHLVGSLLLTNVMLFYNPPMQLQSTIVILYYLIKSMYWYASAKQVCFGYKLTSQENYWTKCETNSQGRLAYGPDAKVSYYRYIGFLAYSACPFLFELRTLLDWSCAQTALTFFEWFKLEDINRQLFLNRQARAMERDAELKGRKEGHAQELWFRLLAGGGIVLGLVCVLWGPLLIFSSAFPSYQSVSVSSVDLNIGFLFSTSAGSLLSRVYQSPVESLAGTAAGTCVPDPLRAYWITGRYTLQCLQFANESAIRWEPSPSAIVDLQSYLNQCVQGTATAALDLRYLMRRSVRSMEMVNFETQFDAAPNQFGTLDPVMCTDLLAAVNAWDSATCTSALSNFTSTPVTIQDGNAPSVVLLTSKFNGEVGSNTCLNGQCDVSVSVNKQWDASTDSCASWWTVTQPNTGGQQLALRTSAQSELTGFVALIQGSGGLVFLYGSVVLLVGRVIRSIFGNQQQLIVFEDMEDVTKPTKLCNAIYIARNRGELIAEERNYRALIQLYRNPSTLFKATKRKSKIE
eukprot:TRINITY_DN10692_c0_g1_i1.p1 TRINITY_DN10692_c0_g1~~TRINITY_DN10692_c0_g1_i1.p1  ORF type:complete len:854 (-),score=129.37 TRINITY_DN10692_c0_g1_i1:216-2777(-)